MLCKICEGLVNRANSDEEDFEDIHHPDTFSLWNSILEKCYVCTIVGKRFADTWLSTKVSWTTFWRPQPGYITIVPKLEESIQPIIVIDFVLPNNSSEIRELISKSPSSFTGSISTIQLAKNWLSDCIRNHPECNDREHSKLWYPTRMISLGGQNNNDIRLIETSELSYCENLEYATLSHCWGTIQLLRLTTTSLSDFKRNIPINTLPKTFRDAIHVAGSLGIQYLWIDSSCIIQQGDDLKDWQKEASLMEKVYSNSLCSIAAVGAKNSSEGLFFDRDMENFFECRVIKGGYWNGQVEEGPLDKRGWFLQEKLLAPRILHFCKEQLFWECRELRASDQFPGGLPHGIFVNSPRMNFLEATGSATNRNNRSNWAELVVHYSTYSLTRPEDKLIAISGVAKHFQSLLRNDTYIAGLWSANLHFSLLWRVTPMRDVHGNWIYGTRSHPYRAPSFSWASVNGPIEFTIIDETVEIVDNFKILDFSIIHMSEDATGQVKDSYLRIRGSIKRLNFQRIGENFTTSSWPI